MQDTTQRTAHRPPPDAGAHRLLLLFGPGDAVGRTIALGLEPVRIGRAPPGASDLALEDPEVSRVHAVVEPEPGDGWSVRDLESRNGTFLDGCRVSHQPLRDGSIIRVGGHVLLFQFVALSDAQRLPVRWPSCSLLGESFRLDRVRSEVESSAKGTAPVLILGETGVGKELVAQEIHRRSERRGRFVAINCAALPDALVESELFGHARGAFTSASAESSGLVAEAAGGTLFLDEVTEMPVRSQAKLLRVLATGEVRRVGDKTARRVDLRVVAATNRDPEEAMAAGAFRGDLYARLAGRQIQVPPLRARRDDILPLFRHLAAEQRGSSVRFTADAAEALLVHPWPFNVRELQHLVTTLPPDVPGRMRIDLPHLPSTLQRVLWQRVANPLSMDGIPLALRVRRDRTPGPEDLAEVLRHFEGNVAQAASFFGRDRKQIYRWAERLGVQTEAFRIRD